MIPIVLTGTIIPNATKVVHHDPEKRRREYLDAIKFYKKFSKVYFLENSRYDISQDGGFSDDENLQCFKFEPSKEFERGKGYQEFQMLDEFVQSHLHEDCFIKVTGRYVYENFGCLLSFILANGSRYPLVIDSFIRSEKALTSFFYVTKDLYLAKFRRLYLQMDDAEGIWSEHVIYRALREIPSYTFFPQTPMLNAISGSTGRQFTTEDEYMKVKIRNMQRLLLTNVGAKRLLV